jgi:hypothetical protein
LRPSPAKLLEKDIALMATYRGIIQAILVQYKLQLTKTYFETVSYYHPKVAD